MPTRDVRVRLSAEGQAEVINAFRRVQEETDKANRSAKAASREGFTDLREAAHKLASEYLALESAMKAFDAIKRAVETSIEYATSIEKAAQKTGFAAETLQVYGLAAQQIGIDQEVVTKGLIKFQKSMGDLETGSVKTKNAIKELFGNSDALKGLPDEARLNKVTAALAKMEPGAKRTAVSIALFGKAGAELLPVIDELGAAGFDNLKKKLEEYGLALDEQGIQRMHQAEAAMADLKLAARGVQMQFTEGLVPALGDVSEGLAKTIGPEGFRGLGEAAGKAIKGTILVVGTLAISLEELYNKIIALVRAWTLLEPVNLGKLVSEKGGIKAALGSIVDTVKTEWATATAYSKAAVEALGQVVADKTQEATKKMHRDPGDADSIEGADNAAKAARERLLKARLEFTQSILADELAVYKETAKLEGDEEKAKYEAGLESIKTYFASRQAAVAENTAREVALLEAKRDAVASAPAAKDAAGELALQKEIADITAKIQILKTEGAEASLRLAHEEGDAQKKNAKEVLDFEGKILTAQGKRHEAEARKIDEELVKFAAALKAEGKLTEDQIKTEVSRVGGILRAGNDFEELKRQAEEGLAEIAAARAKIQDDLARHIISQGTAAKELHALDAARLPTLKDIVAQMQKMAVLSGNADLVKQADEAAKSYDKLDASIEKTKTEMQAAGATLEKDLGRSINTFFTSGITHAKNLGDAMRGLAQSVTADVQKMFLTLIENMIKAKLAAAMTNSSNSFISGIGAGMKAEGGPIYGPGGIDNVPTWLTSGEFVVKEPVARQPGMMALLSAINNGLATPTLKSSGRGYAGGGVVEGGFSTNAQTHRAELAVGLDEGLLLKRLSAHPDFGRVIVKHLDLNRKAATAALGVKFGMK